MLVFDIRIRDVDGSYLNPIDAVDFWTINNNLEYYTNKPIYIIGVTSGKVYGYIRALYVYPPEPISQYRYVILLNGCQVNPGDSGGPAFIYKGGGNNNIELIGHLAGRVLNSEVIAVVISVTGDWCYMGIWPVTSG